MWRLFWQRLAQDKSAQLCLLVIVMITIAGIGAPWFAPHDPTLTSIRLKFQPISFHYPLGTDNLGRCVFSRLLFGIRTTVFLCHICDEHNTADRLANGDVGGLFSR